MFKHLILLLIFFDGFFLSGGKPTSQNESSFKFEAPVVEVFELNERGENIVDSVANTYDKSGALIAQWIYYSDGSEGIFTNYLSINNLNLRIEYVRYKNNHDITTWDAFHKNAIDLGGVNFHNDIYIDQLTDMLYFNAELHKYGLDELMISNHSEFLKQIFPSKYALKIERTTREITFGILGIIISLLLLRWTIAYAMRSLRSMEPDDIKLVKNTS